MAATAARYVVKGRKSATSVKPVTSSKPAQKAMLPRRATSIKAKPVLNVLKKKAPKRRHVWLSTQVRVIRPVHTNVVSMDHAPRTPRPAARTTALKLAGRAQRLAA